MPRAVSRFAMARIQTIQADEKRTQRAWGVQSLPWLILADKAHVVRAKGFGLDELQNRLDRILGETVTSQAR